MVVSKKRSFEAASEYNRHALSELFRMLFKMLFENRAKDEEILRRKEIIENEICANRKKSIQLIMNDPDMSNQMKLALYREREVQEEWAS